MISSIDHPDHIGCQCKLSCQRILWARRSRSRDGEQSGECSDYGLVIWREHDDEQEAEHRVPEDEEEGVLAQPVHELSTAR